MYSYVQTSISNHIMEGDIPGPTYSIRETRSQQREQFTFISTRPDPQTQ